MPRHNLPAPLTSFVRRMHERAEVARLSGTTRLLTLTGPGGVGKTRLALAVATDLHDRFTDGVWLIEFAALSDPDLVARTVAGSFRLHDRPDRSPIDGLVAFLRERQRLLLLDNCEHLVRACAELAVLLLRACPGVRILATSRTPLGIPGEVVWRVPSLSLAGMNNNHVDGSPEASDAAQLFVERARAIRPGFAPFGKSAQEVGEICRRLDGIPLAIELAAARTRVLSIGQIAARLDDRFHLLTGGSRAGLLRHQTLRGTIDWSYALLPDAEQRLLRRLSVFAGGWTLEAAETVCADESERGEILDVLTGLVDHSLVQADEHADEARYYLLETIREYARERLLEAGEADEYRGRHLAWCQALAERFEREWVGPDQIGWLDRLDRELDNVRAALDWSKVASLWGPGLALASALRWYWIARGRLHEGRGHLGDLFRLSAGADGEDRLTTRPAVQPETLAGALDVAGHLALMQGDHLHARPLLEESVTIARRLGSGPGALALRNLSMAAGFAGALDEAEALCEQAIEVGQERGDRLGTSHALFQQAANVYQHGDLQRAGELQEESLALRQEAGDTWNAKNSLFELGNYALAHGQPDRALRLYREALTLARQYRDVRMTGLILEGLAWAANARGQPERAVRLLAAVDALRDVIGFTLFPYHLIEHERTIAAARAALGDRRFEEVWALGRQLSLDEAVDNVLASAATSAPADADGAACFPRAPRSGRFDRPARIACARWSRSPSSRSGPRVAATGSGARSAISSPKPDRRRADPPGDQGVHPGLARAAVAYAARASDTHLGSIVGR